MRPQFRQRFFKKNLQQEMSSSQQKSAKNGPEIHLPIRLNPILVILRFDQKNISQWFFKEP